MLLMEHQHNDITVSTKKIDGGEDSPCCTCLYLMLLLQTQ